MGKRERAKRVIGRKLTKGLDKERDRERERERIKRHKEETNKKWYRENKKCKNNNKNPKNPKSTMKFISKKWKKKYSNNKTR